MNLVYLVITGAITIISHLKRTERNVKKMILAHSFRKLSERIVGLLSFIIPIKILGFSWETADGLSSSKYFMACGFYIIVLFIKYAISTRPVNQKLNLLYASEFFKPLFYARYVESVLFCAATFLMVGAFKNFDLVLIYLVSLSAGLLAGSVLLVESSNKYLIERPQQFKQIQSDCVTAVCLSLLLAANYFQREFNFFNSIIIFFLVRYSIPQLITVERISLQIKNQQKI